MERLSEKLAAPLRLAWSVAVVKFAVRGVVWSEDRGKKDRASARNLHPPRPRGDEHHDQAPDTARPLAIGREGAARNDRRTASWRRSHPAGGTPQLPHGHGDAGNGNHAARWRLRRCLANAGPASSAIGVI